ncbi:MAG: InlB B-repeat-containing protein, partial [Candidatus Methanoplasma sp.]|nr:InlB B-repeat-containing protein [Candidatus Methanoplasma sp.]
GIIVTQGSVTVGSGAEISNNTAATSGGGGICVDSYGGSVTVDTGGAVSGNSAFGNGGGIYVVPGSSGTVSASGTFSGNSAGGDGGAISVSNYANLSSSGGLSFTDNTAGTLQRPTATGYDPSSILAQITGSSVLSIGPYSNYDVNVAGVRVRVVEYLPGSAGTNVQSMPSPLYEIFDIPTLPPSSSHTLTTAVPIWTGNTFNGWGLTKGVATGGTTNGSGNYVAPSSLTITSDLINLTAQWSPKTYTVNYNTNGGTPLYTAKNVTWGESSLLPGSNPTKSGNTFGGWYESSTPVASGTTYSSLVADDSVASITLVAAWVPDIPYTVIYDTAGGSPSISSATVSWGSTGLLPTTTVTKIGQNLDSWKYGTSTVASTTAYSTLAGTDTTSSITLVAQWTGAGYTVNYNSNGGTPVVYLPKAVLWGDTGLLPASSPSRAGYVFDGWHHNATPVTSTTAYSDLAVTTGVTSITLVAQWTPRTYTVNYDVDGGTPSYPSINVTWNSTGLLPASNPVRPGYTFSGWRSASVPVTNGTAYSSLVSNDSIVSVTLKAQWASVSIPVTPGGDLTITAVADSGSTIDPNGSIVVAPGRSATFVYSANPGYSIIAILIDGVLDTDATAAGSYTFYNVLSNHDIFVISAIDSGQLYIVVNIVGGDGTPEYHIGPSATYTKFALSQSVALNADAYVSVVVADGYRFLKWTGEVDSTDIELHFQSLTHTIYLTAHLAGNGGTGDGGDKGDWSPLNLIAAIVAFATGIAALAGGRDRTKEGRGEHRSYVALILRVASLVVGAISIIVFFLTEDWTRPVIPIDEWTLLMFILFLISAAIALLSFRFDDDENEDVTEELPDDQEPQ